MASTIEVVVRFKAEENKFTEIGSWAHTAFCSKDTGSHFGEKSNVVGVSKPLTHIGRAPKV
jgi:hypothetical protein